ncbi:unnamed protein product, partial [Ixodes hexagonus]
PFISAGFLLADARYDVWLGNIRGTKYSRHVKLSRAQREFWDFSADELITFDLPTMLDMVLKTTGHDKIHYVRWSQGALMLFGLLSERPEYNEKVILFTALGPVPYIGHTWSPIKYLLPIRHTIAVSLKLFGAEFAWNTPLFKKIAKDICTKPVVRVMCSTPLMMIADINEKQLNSTRLPVYLSHSPSAGLSSYIVLFFFQLIVCNCFRKFDYGIFRNRKIYGKIKPPRYSLARTRAPVAIYWSKNDWFASTRDVHHLRRDLPNVVSFYEVPDPKFTHIDFAWAANAVEILYKPCHHAYEKI